MAEVWRYRDSALFDEAERAYREAWRGSGGEPCRSYVERRGILREVADAFGLGFAPGGGGPGGSPPGGPPCGHNPVKAIHLRTPASVVISRSISWLPWSAKTRSRNDAKRGRCRGVTWEKKRWSAGA